MLLLPLDWQHVTERETGYIKAGPKDEMENICAFKIIRRQMVVSCPVDFQLGTSHEEADVLPDLKKDCYVSLNCVVLFDANVSLYFVIGCCGFLTRTQPRI